MPDVKPEVKVNTGATVTVTVEGLDEVCHCLKQIVKALEQLASASTPVPNNGN